MYHFFKVGEEVIFHSLAEIRLIVEDINETSGGVRCKYFDENLRRYIKLTLPADSLTRSKQPPAAEKRISPGNK